MSVFIHSYIESVSNPNGRFLSLESIYPETDDHGGIIMSVNAHSADFRVVWNDKRYVLKCLLDANTDRNQRLREVASYVKLTRSPYLTDYTYLENEMLVFDNFDAPFRCDVVLHRIPEGTRLDLIIEGRSPGSGAPKSKLAPKLRKMGIWMSESGFTHGRISLQNIIITSDGSPVLINYEYAGSGTAGEDASVLDQIIEQLEGNEIMEYPLNPANGLIAAEPSVTYNYLGELRDTLRRAYNERDREWVYLDKNGRVVITGGFTDADDFHEGRAVVETTEGFGLINRAGRFVIPPVYDDIEWDGDSNIVMVTREGLSGVCDREGMHITGLVFDHILGGTEFILVKKNGKLGYIRKDGSVAIPLIYDDAFGFRDGFARVRLNGRDYLIDTEGNRIDEIVKKKKVPVLAG